jgi:hypothetical protein
MNFPAIFVMLTSIGGREYNFFVMARIDSELYGRECRATYKSKLLSLYDEEEGTLMKTSLIPGRSRSRAVVAACFLVVLASISPTMQAQGPKVSYYYHPQTELSWARCEVHLQGGSGQKIPFLPVVCSSFRHAPMGTGNFDKDIAVDALLIFAGNGIVKESAWDCYSGRKADYTVGRIDIAGSVVLFCNDFTDDVEAKIGGEFPLARRISEAASRKASAVVVFSSVKEFPFLTVGYKTEAEIPDIPVITITKNSAIDILNSAGVDGAALLREWAESRKPPESQVLISRLSLKIKGKFARTGTRNFLFRYRVDEIPAEQMNELAEVNEKALAFLYKVFGEEKDLRWNVLSTVYFRDYDTKIFYTHHWGLGWATDEGTYMVHGGGVPNFPLAVHENAHILIGLNWGGSTSFLSEGIGKYAEAQAEDRDKNDRQTIEFLKAGKLFPLQEMVAFDIGSPGLNTDVGYPAAGSFVGFIIQSCGLKALKEVYILIARSSDGGKSDAPWQKALGKPLLALEKGWLGWLAQTHPGDAQAIRSYLDRLPADK